MTVQQPASTTPEPTNRPCARKTGLRIRSRLGSKYSASMAMILGSSHAPAGPPKVMKTLCEKSVGRRRRPRRTSLRLVNWTSRRLVLRYCVRHGRSSGSIIWTASSRELVGAGRRIAQDLHQGLDLAVVEAIETAGDPSIARFGVLRRPLSGEPDAGNLHLRFDEWRAGRAHRVAFSPTLPVRNGC